MLKPDHCTNKVHNQYENWSTCWLQFSLGLNYNVFSLSKEFQKLRNLFTFPSGETTEKHQRGCLGTCGFSGVIH